MTTRVQQEMAGAAGKAVAGPDGHRPGSVPPSRKIREEYGIPRAALARMLGVGASTLAGWEKTGRLPPEVLGKARKVEKLLKGLSRVMPKGAVARWLEAPNEASASAGARTPAELIAHGRYNQIEAMIFFFESGVPS